MNPAAMVLFCLMLAGCSLPTEPQTHYEWRGGWVQSPAGQYVWNGVDMEFQP